MWNVKFGWKFGIIKLEVFGINFKEMFYMIFVCCFWNDVCFVLNVKFFVWNVKYLYEMIYDYFEKLNILLKKC